VFATLRARRPIIATRRFAVVTRADDVREILGDHAHFTVPFYDEKMTALSGPFVLGLDDTPLYRRDHAALRAAIRSEDLQALQSATLALGRTRMDGRDGQIDVVRELVDPVVGELITDYFGTPGPSTAQQLRWAKDIFEDVFLNVGNKRSVHERAVAAAAQMRPHLDALIATRRTATRAGEPTADDVLGRLLAQPAVDGGMHDIAVRHNLVGLIAAWIPTMGKAFASAIEELLCRPSECDGAARAAREGDQDLVGAYLFEALRFRPQTPALLRTCAEDYVVAAGTPRATLLHEGSRVLVATQSAMFDEHAVEDPSEFRVDRPWREYLHFGHGLHECFGESIIRAHLPALGTALLERGAVRRAPGAAGQLAWAGPFPSSLTVAWAGA